MYVPQLFIYTSLNFFSNNTTNTNVIMYFESGASNHKFHLLDNRCKLSNTGIKLESKLVQSSAGELTCHNTKIVQFYKKKQHLATDKTEN